MAANSMTTGTEQTSINIQAGQTTEVSVASGQSLIVGADVASISKGEGGALVLKFSNGATLVVKNYADIAGMEKSPTITLADGKTVELAVLVSENVNQLVSTAMEGSAETAAEVNVISKPKANEDLVVKLEEGETYKFGFAMNEPVSVKNNEGQLVIAFKNGGEIIIPNYGAMKNSAHGVPAITMQDGASIPLSEFGDVLATATQLNLVEPAAGDTAGGGAGRAGGFGFQSSFTATPFNSLDPIGPINPTKLQYNVSDRRPEPEFIPTAPAPVPPTADQPNLEVVDKQVKEDGSVVLHIEASLNDIDGSEVLTVSVSGITAGWGVDTSVSGGTYDATTGTWTLTLPAGVTSFSGGPTLSPPANSDADLTGLVVTATATETVGGDTATQTAIVNVITDAVIDAPSINAPDAQGNEDTSIPLSITVSKGGDNLDGSEVLSNITISGVPAGAVLSAGSDLGGGVWSLTTAQLVGLTLTPAHNFNGNFTLTVSVTDTEANLSGAEFDTSDNSATATDTLLVTVAPVADDPTVSVVNGRVKEDGATNNPTDGSVQPVVTANLAPGSTATDYMVITISGIAAGWGVNTATSGGTYNAGTGTWTHTVPAGQNYSGAPVFSPPANSDADLTGLVVTVRQFDASNTLLGTGTGTVSIVTDAVIDAPTLVANDVSGAEDTAIALDITIPTNGDTDGSEVLSNITISGVPAGASLSAGADLGGGVWSLTTAQLAGLTLTPAHNFNGDITLTVSVTDTETNLSGAEFDTSDNTATVTDTLVVHVGPADDNPTVRVSNGRVKEDSSTDDPTDGSVPLVITATLAPGSTATDHMVVTISGIAAGWGVSASGGTFDSVAGTWTFTVPNGQNFTGGPVFSPPANSDADLTGLVVTVQQFDASNTLLGTGSAPASIVTDAVIDAPTLVVPDITGNEDTAIPLNITVTKGGDTTDGSEVLSNITISGVPTGAVLSAGTNLGGGVWSLTTAQLAGLTITPKAHFSGNFNLTVSVTDTEANLSGGEFDLTDNTATVSDVVKVTVTPVADQPNLTVTNKQVKEDGSVALTINASLVDTDGSETLTVSIAGITAGWGVNTAVSGGTYNAGTGVWTLTLPAGVTSFSGGPTLSPPANSDADLTGLVVTATATDGASTATRTATMNVVTDAVIDAPTLVVPDVTGNEDTAIPLNITVTRGGDTLDGSEVLSNITISGVPAGATLSAGSNLGGGVWSLTTAQLVGLTLTPAHNFNGNFNLTISVTDTETNLSGAEFDLTDNTATVTDTVKVTVNPVGDDPSVSANDVQVKEDGSVQLVVNATLSPGSQPTEYMTITISGITAGWGVNTTASGGTFNSAAGTWTLTVPAGQNYAGGPVFSPPTNSDVDLNGLVVTARQFDASNTLLGSATDGANIAVDAVIDAPTLVVPDITGNEDTAIPLNITVTKGGDSTDGSEVLSNVTISGVPAGAVLSAGSNLGGGVWSLTTAQLAGLTITPKAHFSGNFNLTVSVTDTETNLSGVEFDLTDNTATVSDVVKVTVTPVADQPNLSVTNKQVKEDGSVALQINASLVDTDGSETLTVSIAGITAGWGVNTSVSGGTYNAGTGVWTLTLPAGVTSFSGGPTLSPPANSDADLTGLLVTATATDGASTATRIATMNVVTDAVIDAPTLVVPDITGNEDTAIPLNITVTKGGDNLDGSEVLSNITISGVPTGAVLSAGSNLGGGVWSLTTAQLAGLTITPKAHFSGNFNLTVSVTDTETNLSGVEFDLTDNTATISDTVKVTVNPVADQPNLTVTNKQVKEDGSVALTINASLVDTDGSETLTVSVAGITAGWGVNTAASGGTYNAGTGVWTLTLPAGVTSFSGGPTLSPPANSDADLTGLVVTATATETATGAIASRTALMNIVTDAVIDAPTLVAGDVTGGAGTEIPLTITVTKGGDTLDGSEVLSNITISGVPAGAVLNHGTDQGGGVWSLTQADLVGLTIKPSATSSGNFNLTVSVTDTETNLSGSEFDLTDNSATASDILTLTVEAPVFKVGKNVDDKDGSTTTYEVGGGPGKIIGNGAGDVLVGDVGGSSLENVNKDYNIVLILDVSGSMAGSKLTLLKSAVNNLMGSFHDYTGGAVKVHLVTFSDQTKSEATFTVTNLTEFNSAKTFVNGLVANGWTNYEDPLQDAITWLQSTTGNKPIAGAETYTYFVSDGEPNRVMNNSGTVTEASATRVMQEITGTYNPTGTSNDDLVSEVAIIQSLSTQVIGVGISITATTLARLDVIDSTAGGALDVQDPADLSEALQGASPLNKLADVGGDVLTAGGGDDILFGDSLFTDDLAAAHGLTTTAGAGWDVFAKLEAGLSAVNPGWTRADTIAYIKANAEALSAESLGSGGTPRTGGNDTLEGGSGSDMIFGQEGNDMIIGGLGDDLLSGGTGADTFLISSMGEGADTITDFSVAQGDVLDISNILTGFDPLTESLHDFVKVVNSGGDSIVQVDTTGTGTAYQTVAVLEGVTLDVDTLANNGNLIA